MEALTYTALAIAILAYGLVSARAERSIFSAPMVFVVFGFLAGHAALGVVEIRLDDEVVKVIAELALILILFTDASRIDLRLFIREHRIPVRLLGIGFPLTALLGAAVAVWMFDALSLWEACLIAIVLAPTDAALGQGRGEPPAAVPAPERWITPDEELVPEAVGEALAAALGINATPTFVIGDQLIPGAIDLDALKQLVAQARAS